MNVISCSHAVRGRGEKTGIDVTAQHTNRPAVKKKYTQGKRSMNITDVRIRKVDKEGKMKAVVSITIDNEFAVHDIKIIEGEKGVFIAMPSRKNAEGEYRDVAHPINSDTRTQLQEMIMEKYREEIAEA
ncbi:putative stage V sporulation protein G [Eubacterium ramulus ATCC 29099]|uniref:Putative septation protein SpoVG n=2 Tax=Eubacterium ramulus TaxID=39490 RepID=U2QK19_EUBRA|nr:putative stage V sporulation protein G [Eubacterium ramulus ATCC 29099]